MKVLNFFLINVVVAFIVSVGANTFGSVEWINPPRKIDVTFREEVHEVNSGSGVKFLIDGEEVDSYSEFYFDVFNAGRVVFEPSDFIRPLTFNFSKDVVFYGVQNGISNNENIHFSQCKGALSLVPMVINPKEHLMFKVLTSAGAKFNGVTAKIRALERVNWKDIDDVKKYDVFSMVDFFCAIAIFLALVIAIAVDHDGYIDVVMVVVLAAALTFMSFKIFRNYGFDVLTSAAWHFVIICVVLGASSVVKRVVKNKNVSRLL
ncbi:hypothetical protein [Nitratidesulfovibrio liaohensis]|uniref:hypothetical protein n=1 Tax=Nitratidesulfovibrio liaohensis TaxID=2604158 RepID=UPI00141E4D2B|nr:hypothetical protein [Nitratidesulfovibrio liaohensis]NHZ45834.1 hypothetical protein [Nitratidesulfovibrio liaohensis]